MSIKRIIPLVIFCLISLSLKGQGFEFRPAIGWGTYAMADFKDFQQYAIPDIGVNVESVKEFPGYANFGADVLYYLNPSFGFGATTGYYSTGARNSYADYSGSYRMDIKARAVNFGGIVSYKQEVGSNLFLGLELSSGIKLANIDIAEKLVIPSQGFDETYQFESHNWWMMPQVRISRYFFTDISFGIYAGYEYNAKSKIETRENVLHYLVGEHGPVKQDWSGTRVGVYVTIPMNNL